MTSMNGHHNSFRPIGNPSDDQFNDRLKLLYPTVNEDETPLPRCWSSSERCSAIVLSHNNMRIRYQATEHSDAAAVRTDHPIPITCIAFYFEVKIISEGSNGYIGIGFTGRQFHMNRLPGEGESYGPTYTTGDTIGCYVDFITKACFYTKNGTELEAAARNLPSVLYPAVGLQSNGAVLEVNFGQEPFEFRRVENMLG